VAVLGLAQYARHLRKFRTWLQAEALPDDVLLLEPEYVARFLSAEAMRRPGWADEAHRLAEGPALEPVHRL
jgi:hypothetical protein